MLRAASNPDTNKIETIIATLPKARQEEIYRIFAEIAARQKQQQDDAAKAVLLLGLLSLGGLLLSYLLTTDQEALTAAQLLEQMKRAWVNAVQDEIDYCGCNARARGASGSDLLYLQSLAERDAQSIVQTYNKDVNRQLNKLFEQYPTASKQFYIESMKAWAEERAGWKLLSISFMTEANAREYARMRFASENYAETTRWVFVGPPAICQKCMRLFAAGIVDWSFVQNTQIPVHHNCPHFFRPVRKPKVDCSRLWVG